MDSNKGISCPPRAVTKHPEYHTDECISPHMHVPILRSTQSDLTRAPSNSKTHTSWPSESPPTPDNMHPPILARPSGGSPTQIIGSLPPNVFESPRRAPRPPKVSTQIFGTPITPATSPKTLLAPHDRPSLSSNSDQQYSTKARSSVPTIDPSFIPLYSAAQPKPRLLSSPDDHGTLGRSYAFARHPPTTENRPLDAEQNPKPEKVQASTFLSSETRGDALSMFDNQLEHSGNTAVPMAVSGVAGAPPQQTPTPSSTSRNVHHSHTHSSQGGTSHKSHKRRSIGDWDFEESIGSGSMGQVKLARNRYTGAQCAVKVIPKGHAERRKSDKPQKESDESKDIRSVREASIGRLLHHPNICQLYEVYSMTNHFYLLFEYVSGGQMLDYIISHGSLKEKNARKFARSITSALDYCHHNSVVHRDLKIENIMISDEGEIKIIDFGLSNLFRPTSFLTTFCGSLYFAAPELLNAQPYIGPEVDIWSFGIVLYVLVCGKVPFDDQNMPALHEKIKKGKVEYPNWLSAECRDLLQRILVVNCKDRITLHEVMNHPWMCRGYEGPPESYIPFRRPIMAPLDRNVMQQMSSFEFGSLERIESTIDMVVKSSPYRRAVYNWHKVHDPKNMPDPDYIADLSSISIPGDSSQSPSMSPSLSLIPSNGSNTTFSQGSPQQNSAANRNKHFGFDFHRRRSFGLGISHHSSNYQIDQYSTFKEIMGDGLDSTGDIKDPTDAYYPLLSMYYLVSEDIERRAAAALAQAKMSRGTSLSAQSLQSPSAFASEAINSPSGAPSGAPSSVTISNRPSNEKHRNSNDTTPNSVSKPGLQPVSLVEPTSNMGIAYSEPRTPQPKKYETPLIAKPDPVHAADHGLAEIAPHPLEMDTTHNMTEERSTYRSSPGTGSRTRSRTHGAADQPHPQHTESPLQNPFASYNVTRAKEGFASQKQDDQRQQIPEQKSSKRHQTRYSEPQNSVNSPLASSTKSGGFAGSLLRRLSTSRRKENSRSSSVHGRKTSGSPFNGDSSRNSSGGLTRKNTTNGTSSSPPPPIPPMPHDFRYPMGGTPSKRESAVPPISQPTPPPPRGTASGQQQLQPQLSQDLSEQVEGRMENLSINSPAAKNRTKQYHPSARAKSMGHARRESALVRYYQHDETPPAPQLPHGENELSLTSNDIFDEVALESPSERIGRGSYVDDEQMLSIQFPKQVFLKGFFSVQSTSTKSLLYIRSDIIRVLNHLGINHKEIRGGFLCYHRPSIRSSNEEDYSPVSTSGGVSQMAPANSSPPASPQTPGHWRKLSFGSGMIGPSRRKSVVFGTNNNSSESNHNMADSDMSQESIGGGQHVNGGSDMLGFGGGSRRPTPLRFEVYIVKVPLLTLHGIQFKKLTGNSWQYKNLATKILSELRL